MIRMIRLKLFLLAGLLLAACAQSTAPEPPPWRIVSASAVAGPQNLIVTVPVGEKDDLAALAAELEADHPVVLVAEWPLKGIGVHCFVFQISGVSSDTAVASLAADMRVRMVQPMQEFQTLASSASDDLLGLQAGLHEIDVVPAHEIATGRGVRVGVIDTRLDASHPDLSPVIRDQRDFVRDSAPARAEQHGTAVAGVIGADAANRSGIVGVAPGAEIIALRGCWEAERGAGRCSSFSLAQAINFALLNDIDVLNLSIGGPHDPLLAELIGAALARNMIVVAAYGPGDMPRFPASEDGVIAVSVWGDGADRALPALLAPGTDVLSTAPDGAFDFFSGSSVAAAHVSGLAALLREVRPAISPLEASKALGTAGAASLVNGCAALLAIAQPTQGTACRQVYAER